MSEQFDRAVDGGKFTNIFYLDFHKPLAKLSQQTTKEFENVVLQGKPRPLNKYQSNFIQVIGINSTSNLEALLNAVGIYIFYW